MEIDFKELLANVQSVVKEAKKSRDFVQPERAFIYATFLVPVGYKTGNLDNYYHYFNIFPLEKPHNVDVLHGHESSIPCAASHYCHLYGYRPGLEHNPSFRKMFENKWKPIYGELW